MGGKRQAQIQVWLSEALVAARSTGAGVASSDTTAKRQLFSWAPQKPFSGLKDVREDVWLSEASHGQLSWPILPSDPLCGKMRNHASINRHCHPRRYGQQLDASNQRCSRHTHGLPCPECEASSVNKCSGA